MRQEKVQDRLRDKGLVYHNGFILRISDKEDEAPLMNEITVPVNEDVENAILLMHSLMKRQIANVINGKADLFDYELRKAVCCLWQNGYSEGLKHMDLMHGKIDNL